MSAPPSITINHVQVAEIGKNYLLKSLVKTLVRKPSKQQCYWTLELEENSLIRILSKTRRSRQRTRNIPLKFLMWMGHPTNEEQSQNTPG